MRFLSRRAAEDASGPNDGDLDEAPDRLLLLHDGRLLAKWFIEYRLKQEVDRAKRYDRPLSVLVAVPTMLLNERLTDAALDAAVSAAVLAARETDLVGWIGEDRIMVIMPETNGDRAKIAMSRWRDEMWLRSRGVGGQKWQLTVLDALTELADFTTLDAALATGAGEQRAS